VPAALLNYNFNSYHSSNLGSSQTTSYLGLNAGLNIGLWQLRQDSTAVWQSATAGTPARMQWQNIDAYVRRELPSLRAQLTIGDSYTDGEVFDSYGIRGVQLATDDRMLPQSLQGYAPVIHGVAQTNALVTVRQNGVQIYQTTVAPGPFTISDLYPTGYGGNLTVAVTEADGRVSTFSVPYASVTQLLRPGVTRYDISAGQLRNLSLLHKPNVLQATVQHGFNNLFTGYAGIVASQGYAAALVGGAINTRYGALGLDITQADARVPGYASQDGHSVRVTYSKIIPSTGTSLTVAAYRYSTSGYLSLADAAIARDYATRGINPFQYVPPTPAPTIDGVPEQSVLTPAQLATLDGSLFTNDPVVAGVGLQRQRNNFTLTLNQRLGQEAGSLYASGSMSDYWNRTGTDTQFQLGYNNSWHRLSYSVSATRTRDSLGRYDNEYMVNFTVPLGSSPHAPSFTMNLAHDQNGGAQDQAALNGSLGTDNQFNYGASATHTSQSGQSGGNAASVNAGYRSPYTVLSASYGDGNGYSQASISANGSVIAHPGGITFGQPIGDTVGIVYIPGAEGARLNNASGARVDRFGYAVVPYLTPYMLNTIQIDPKGLPLDVQLDATSAQVAPYAGAVVMLKFKTESGRAVIFNAHLPNGQALPFGAEVFNEKDSQLGVVGQAGQILVRGVNPTGLLTARWQDDNGANLSCSFPYKLAPRVKGKQSTGYEEIKASCTQPVKAVTNGSDA
jgi:outer membrane usher protein